MDALRKGYAKFLEKYLDPGMDEYREKASHGQSPRVMSIACCDSRFNPVVVTDSPLGDIFSLKNVANLVPPIESGHDSVAGAVQFAVTSVGVRHIIVVGHSGCVGVRTLMETGGAVQDSPVHSWVKCGLAAREKVLREHGDKSLDEQCDICERTSIVNSLSNLANYPWVKEALEAGTLQIHGWHFDIGSGVLTEWNPEKQEFLPVL